MPPIDSSQTATEVQLTRACAADIESILDMMVDFNRLEAIVWARETGRLPLLTLLRSPEIGLVLRIVEGAVDVGYCVLTWGFDLEWSGRDAFLTELYLCPHMRSRGLGRHVVARVEQIAAEHGARALHLLVRPENEPAVRLYRSAGFEAPPRVFMTKQLDRLR